MRAPISSFTGPKATLLVTGILLVGVMVWPRSVAGSAFGPIPALGAVAGPIQGVEWNSGPAQVGEALAGPAHSFSSDPSAPLTPARTEAPADPLLTLEEALALAREGSPLIQLARTEVAQAANRVGLGAVGLLPRLSVQGSRSSTTTYVEQTFLNQEPRELRGASSSQWGGGAALTWRAFDGGGRLAELDRLRALEVGEASALEEVRDRILTDVVVAYHDLVRREAELRVLAEAVELSDERLRIARVREEVGAGSEVAVRQAQVDRNADQAQLIRARSGVVEARTAFNRLLGRPPATPFTVRDDIPLDEELEREGVLHLARARSPSAEGARAALSAAVSGEREARADWFPSLDLRAGFDYTDLTSGSGFLQAVQGFDYSLGLSLNFDLFDGFDRNRRGEEARLRTRSAEITLRDVESRIEAEVEVEWVRYRDQLELVGLERENLELARRNADTALEQFRLGAISSLELREVQQALTRAGIRLIESEFGTRAAEAELRRLMGELEGC